MSVCWTGAQPKPPARARATVTRMEFWIGTVIAFLAGAAVGLMVACVFAVAIHRMVAP